MVRKTKRKTQKVTGHFREGKFVKTHKRKKRKRKKGKGKKIKKKFEITWFQNANGELIGKRVWKEI